ncbi:hypothetical protein DPMN_150653 [Dreissena polymorpha]|uniref:Uncharacterized protein n=1 Tax=Dreissena polymorpha TaxID=45954 RepID=A0A9D4FDU1_DREPO|nr:hypothetical protein DPMN_150653 [Dreissena polymorpha]
MVGFIRLFVYRKGYGYMEWWASFGCSCTARDRAIGNGGRHSAVRVPQGKGL